MVQLPAFLHLVRESHGKQVEALVLPVARWAGNTSNAGNYGAQWQPCVQRLLTPDT